MSDNGFLLVGAAAFGLVLGSYAVTAGLRLADGESATLGRSRCDGCRVSLGFLQTVPVASYFALRGACRTCGAKIEVLHLIGEIAGAAVLASAVWVAQPMRAAALGVLGLTLLAAAAVDAKIQRLPNGLMAVVALCCAVLALGAGRARILEGSIAAAATATVLCGLRVVSQRLRGDPGLGLGDVKLIVALSLWLGRATPIMVGVAALLGLLAALVTRQRHGRTAFGPMVALSAWGVGIVFEKGWSPWAP